VRFTARFRCQAVVADPVVHRPQQIRAIGGHADAGHRNDSNALGFAAPFLPRQAAGESGIAENTVAVFTDHMRFTRQDNIKAGQTPRSKAIAHNRPDLVPG